MTDACNNSWFEWQGDDLLLNLQIQPRSSKDEFAGPYGENAYKVRITAPPVDGRANKHLCKYLARAFGVGISHVSLLGGETGRKKRLRIYAPKKLPLPVTQP